MAGLPVTMPTPLPVFDPAIEQIVRWIAPRSALDIGAGDGRLARMLRQAAPECRCAGIEGDARLVAGHGLAALYAPLYLESPASWWREHPEAVFDLVHAGASLTRMAHSEGIDLLQAMVHRAAWLLLVLPEFGIDSPADEPASARPASVWNERSLHWHDLWAFDHLRSVTLVLMRGLQPSATTIDELLARAAAAPPATLDFDGRTPVRPLGLRLVEHPRETAYRPR